MHIAGTGTAHFFTSSYSGSTTDGYYFFGTPGGSKYINYVASNGIFILNGAGLGIATGNLTMYAGGVSILDGFITAKKVGAAGNISIDTTLADSKLTFQHNGVQRWMLDASGTQFIIYNESNTSGVFLNSQAATSWSALSDERIKTDIETLPVLDMLKSFRAVRYTNMLTGAVELGVIAQEQIDQWPELIHRGSDGELALNKDDDDEAKMKAMQETWSASYDRFGPIALQGVKELLARVVALETELAALRAKSP
jgi:hypothetical protein